MGLILHYRNLTQKSDLYYSAPLSRRPWWCPPWRGLAGWRGRTASWSAPPTPSARSASPCPSASTAATWSVDTNSVISDYYPVPRCQVSEHVCDIKQRKKCGVVKEKVCRVVQVSCDWLRLGHVTTCSSLIGAGDRVQRVQGEGLHCRHRHRVQHRQGRMLRLLLNV